MDPIPARVRSLWDAWDLRILVLLSLTLQIILSLFGSRRKYVSSLWINIFVWSTYLMADWVAIVALGKLSDAQSDYANGNALWAIWAPLLLLHLGGPDSITAYSLEDNQFWLRHFFGLVVQFSVAVYVVLMSWKYSWFSIMSIPALVVGFIKYGERTWVLMSVSHDKFRDNVPFGHPSEGERSNADNNSTSEEDIRILYLGYRLLECFMDYMQNYDPGHLCFFPVEFYKDHDRNLFWNVLGVEMGLMFDLLYTKATINYSKVGCILRCITFAGTVTVLVGLIFRLIFMGENREKWHEVDIAITMTLLVGALALEIYGIITIYLCSDWAMLWLIKRDRGNQVIQLRKRISWLFLPKQYWSKTMGQFDLLDFWLKGMKPNQNLGRRILDPLLGIDRFKDKFNMYIHKTAVACPLALFNAIFDVIGHLHVSGYVEMVPDFALCARYSLDEQILYMNIVTEICYHTEMERDTHDASNSSSLWEENKKLCRTLSHYMMHLLFMCPSLLPIDKSDAMEIDVIRTFKKDIEGALDVKVACRKLCEDPYFGHTVNNFLAKRKCERWEILKYSWSKLLCYAASKGPKNEHLRQLTQGGELLTLVWFVLPLSMELQVRSNPYFHRWL